MITPLLSEDDAAPLCGVEPKTLQNWRYQGLGPAFIKMPGRRGKVLKSFVGKLDGIALRLALAIELANWAWLGGDEPRSVSAASVVAVADFIEGYALPMAQRVYGDAGLPAVERNAASVARYLRRSKLTSFNARDLRRTAGLPGLRDAEPFKEALDALVEAEWLRPAPTRHGATVGRRTSDYLVNPAIYGAANG